MENIGTALLLMVVGMTTVFIILLTVINLGKLLIYLVNKYAPEEEVSLPLSGQASNESQAAVPGDVLTAITTAVNMVTSNKGKIVKVEKL
ncbi:oxaloacetate decarboxylase gamma chain [termite gut metagenome]|uniref:Oxaloacetate decarboxylase gamma chain n=1 Tax=termite gut metagenome TaxID=433724 RepID=A0A5J4SWH9_9ZZZZ